MRVEGLTIIISLNQSNFLLEYFTDWVSINRKYMLSWLIVLSISKVDVIVRPYADPYEKDRYVYTSIRTNELYSSKLLYEAIIDGVKRLLNIEENYKLLSDNPGSMFRRQDTKLFYSWNRSISPESTISVFGLFETY